MDGLGYVQTFIRCHRMVSDRRLHTYWLPVARQAQTPTHQQSVGGMGRAAMRSSWIRAALIAPGRRFAAARHPAVQTVTERFLQRRHRSIQSVSQVHRAASMQSHILDRADATSHGSQPIPRGT